MLFIHKSSGTQAVKTIRQRDPNRWAGTRSKTIKKREGQTGKIAGTLTVEQR